MTTVAKAFKSMDRDEKISEIENILVGYNTNEGSLWARYYRSQGLTFYVGTKPDIDNTDLCVEAVSQTTLFELFGEDHDYTEGDAERIVEWMLAQ